MYLNLYVPILQQEQGVAWFFKQHRGHSFASSALMAPMTHAFVEKIETYAAREGLDLITFRRGQRKEDIAKEYLEGFKRDEGVLFIGKAQEKAKVIRTERRRNPRTDAPYAWLVKSSTPVNQYYFYCVDRGFGLFFIKFCSYFPYNGKLCINGHEYLKRQLRQRRIRFRPLDNGVVSCSQPEQMQQLADQLDAKRIDVLARKWFRRWPHPFPRKILRPTQQNRQRSPALRFGDPRVLALLSAIVLFRFLFCGFTNSDLRSQLATLLGLTPAQFTQGKMTYDLRRLRLHGLITRIPNSHRYRVTEFGFRAAVLLTRTYARVLRPGYEVLSARDPPQPAPLRKALLDAERAIDKLWRDAA